MKNKLLTLAGTLALIAVVGKFYAAPAIAQVVRAALTKNIDEKGRNPYSSNIHCLVGGGSGVATCAAAAGPIPAGMRLVVENVNLRVDIPVGTSVQRLELQAPPAGAYVLPVSLTSTIGPPDGRLDRYFSNSNLTAYFEAGSSPSIGAQTNGTAGSVDGTITGYLINLAN